MTANGTLPHSVEAEQGALGSMLISPNEAIREAINRRIEANHFYIPAHRTIYTVLVDRWNAAAPIDFITFTQVLRDQNLLEGVGGASFVTHLFTFVPTAANVGHYLDIVQEKHRRRALTAFASSLGAAAQDEAVDFDETVAEVQQRLVAFQSEHRNGSELSIRSADEILALPWDERSNFLGDRLLTMAGLLVIAGVAGVGKTRLLLQLRA